VTGNGGRDGKHGEERRFAQEYADGVKDDIYAEVEKSAVRGLFAKRKIPTAMKPMVRRIAPIPTATIVQRHSR